MRALVLLLLVVIAFLVVVKFYPPATEAKLTDETASATPFDPVEGAAPVDPVGGARPPADAPSGVTPASEPKPRFLERPSRPAAAEPAPVADPASLRGQTELGETALEAPEAPPGDTIPSWLADVEAPLDMDAGEVPIAATLVHAPQSLPRVLNSFPDFPESRARLASAFIEAVHGSASKGKSLAAAIDAGDLTEREKELLQAAIVREAAHPRAPYAESPLVLGMEMSLAARNAELALREARYADAAVQLSELLLAEIDAPWTADRTLLQAWAERLELAQTNHRWDPAGDWPSALVEVQPGDSLTRVRKRYVAAHTKAYVCTGLIQAANGLPSDILQPGQKLRVPTDPVRMVVDLESRWAFYLFGSEVAAAWPIGVGRPGEETPPGNYVARGKLTNPPWMRVGQEMIPFGDARNPLGTRWIAWYRDGVKTSYGFHGTKEPESIGQASSDGCVRLHNEDVERLFEILPEGSPVRVKS